MLTTAQSTRVIAPENELEAEFERFAAGLVGTKIRESISERRGSDVTPPCPRPSTSAAAIYERALELVDREGIDALTSRRLAADLNISTRTLYKRIGSRERLIRELISAYSARLILEFRPQGTWEETVWGWCLQVYQALTDHPHLTDILRGRTSTAITAHVDALIDASVRHGLPRTVADESCRAVADLTINDALAYARAWVVGDTLAQQATRMAVPSKAATDAVKWILCGVRAESYCVVDGLDDEPG